MARTDRISGDKLPVLVARLAAGERMADAAKAAGLSERQAYRRLAADPEQRRLLGELRRQRIEAGSARLADLTDDAIDALHEVMTDPETPAATRLAAARCLLEHTGKLAELAVSADVGERLTAIEDVLDRLTRPRGAVA